MSAKYKVKPIVTICLDCKGFITMAGCNCPNYKQPNPAVVDHNDNVYRDVHIDEDGATVRCCYLGKLGDFR